MSIAASLEVINSTGTSIFVAEIDQVNDDSTWNAPASGTTIPDGSSISFGMGNSSFIPLGCGCNFQFVNAQGQAGNIYMDVPAFGSNTVTGASPQNAFLYTIDNPNGNSYVVTITAPADFDDMIVLPELSLTRTAMAANNGNIYIAWIGVSDNKINLMCSTDNGQTFSNLYTSEETSWHAPALCSNNGFFTIAWTGMDGHINLATIEMSGEYMNGNQITGFTGKIRTKHTSPYGPALASWGDYGIYLAWTGDDNHVILAHYADPATQTSRYESGETSSQAPALGMNNVNFFIAWKGDGNDNLNVATGDPNPISGEVKFGDPVILPETSPINPALAYDWSSSRMYLAWKGDGNDNLNLMYASFSAPDGVSPSWSGFGNKLISAITSGYAPTLCDTAVNWYAGMPKSKVLISWPHETPLMQNYINVGTVRS